MVNNVKRLKAKRKADWKKANAIEDTVIKRLEKKLNIKKKSNKLLPKSFVSDGLDYILDVCDGDTSKILKHDEEELLPDSSELENFDDYNLENKAKTEDETNGFVKKKKPAKSDDSGQFLSQHRNKDADLNCNKNINKHVKSKSKKRTANKSDVTKNSSPSFNAESSDDSFNGNDLKSVSKKKKKNDNKKNTVRSSDASIEKIETDDESSLAISNSIEENEEFWEDIYGRKRTKDGSIVSENKQKFTISTSKLKCSEANSQDNDKLLKRQIKGLFNRLAESNMHVIISKLEELYMSNSKNNMNVVISTVVLESIVAPILTPERLIIEHMMCIAILHANIGTEIGAHFIMTFVKQFNERIKAIQTEHGKELDNVCLMICHLYNFKVLGSQLIYQMLDKLKNEFSEKEIELVLLILKTTGFKLRKDNPTLLKEFILKIQQKAATVKSSDSRIQYMLEVLLAIKNNNTNKIPYNHQSYVERSKKNLKTIIRKGYSIVQLNISFEDLLNADQNGKWWIVGSAWTGKSMPNNESKKPNEKLAYDQKIFDLAQSQRMNTDIRKNIFCILMTAEDYLDAFEKLHHLGLKDQQEREIIYVILNCLLQERTFNPYYCILIQKFCEYDRKYRMIMQHTLWDKLKSLDSHSNKQIMSIAGLMTHLFIHKALSLSVLKVIEFGDLDSPTMKLVKKIMLDILLHKNVETCLQVFEKVLFTSKLHQFRNGLRLFINYFLLKNIKKETIPEKKFELLTKRIEIIDKLLAGSTGNTYF